MGMVRLIIKEHCFEKPNEYEPTIKVMQALAIYLEDHGLLPIMSVVEIEHIPSDGKPVTKYSSTAVAKVEKSALLLLKDCVVTGSTQVPTVQGPAHTIQIRTLLSSEEYTLPVTGDFIAELSKLFPDGGPAICDIELCIFPKEDPGMYELVDNFDGYVNMSHEVLEADSRGQGLKLGPRGVKRLAALLCSSTEDDEAAVRLLKAGADALDEDAHLSDFVPEERPPCRGYVTTIRDETEACLHCGLPKAAH